LENVGIFFFMEKIASIQEVSEEEEDTLLHENQ
jgi:hypothetical protein